MGQFCCEAVQERQTVQFKQLVKNACFSRGVQVNKLAPIDEVRDFISLIRHNTTNVDLIRIGGDGDGGYLVPNDLTGIKYCFSPGVGFTASFENELTEKHGIKCFMADASVDVSPVHNAMFEFDSRFLGAKNDGDTITLRKWLQAKVPADEAELILQMDIEGAEFEVLIESSIECLRRFRVMVIEFHGLQSLFYRTSLPHLRAIFQKLLQEFSIAHMHPNNVTDLAQFDGTAVPPTLEMSFIRKDRVENIKHSGQFSLPHPLDYPNVDYKPNLKMPEIWWA